MKLTGSSNAFVAVLLAVTYFSFLFDSKHFEMSLKPVVFPNDTNDHHLYITLSYLISRLSHCV